MNVLDFFENNIYPNVNPLFGIVETVFDKEGDFGYLTRFSLYSNKKLANIEIWSRGWIGFEIYNIENRDLIMVYSKIISPENMSKDEFYEFEERLFDEI